MIMRYLDPTKQPKKFCIPDPNLAENFQYECIKKNLKLKN